jgi:hypothetical protein
VIARIILFGLVVVAGLVVAIAPALTEDQRLDGSVPVLLAFGIYAAIGGLIVFRRDGHLTGWLLALTGLAVVAADRLPSFPGLSEFGAAWISSGGWGVVFALFAALTLTFPAGHAPQGDGFYPRLGRFALWSLPFLVFTTFFTEILTGPEGVNETTNPYGFVPETLGYAALIAIVLVILGGAISLALRRRRATGVERAQLTWVVFGLVLFVTTVLLTFAYIFISIGIGAGDPGDDVWAPVFLLMLLFPLTFGIAILRYRLYDIDRIVSRTVTYASLAGLLAATYFLVVTLLSSQLQGGNELAVAASTLVVAALFNPLRIRLHSWVDRRFNRARYDAQQVADRFARDLQDDMGQGRLVTDLLGVVSQTMEPAVLSVWVRSETDPTIQ